MKHLWIPALAGLLLACDKGTPTTTDPTDSPTPTDTPTPTGDTGPVIPTADTAPQIPVVDCTTPPSGPFSGRQLGTPRAYHGLAFDKLGNMVGGDNTNLLISDGPDSTQVLVPNIGWAQQMDYLPNGDLAIAIDFGPIQAITPAGARITLAGGINAYGVEVGPDGFIYTANQNVIHRIDPVGGGAQVYVGAGAINTPKVVTFDKEGTQMFVGTNFSSGQVWRFEIDSNGQPVLPGQVIGTTGGSWHDGIEMDACGRLYLAEYNTRSLYMLTEGQGSTQLIDAWQLPAGGSAYGHGLQWGSGIGAWGDHKLYVPLPYGGNRVAEIDIGVPHKDYNGGEYEIVE